MGVLHIVVNGAPKMISNIELWQEYLVRTANSLLHRMVQKKWSDRSVFCLEKELFLGFFTARKLIEANAVTRDCIAKTIQVIRFPTMKMPDGIDLDRLPYEVVPDSKKTAFSIRDVCNLFIHSWHIVPFGANGVMVGFFITSEFERKKGIYLITIFELVEILRACAGREGLIDKQRKKDR